MESLKKALRKFFSKAYTEKYPLVPSPPPLGYRGAPEVDPEYCMGCGICWSSCPADAILATISNEKLVLRVNYGKCVFCGRCVEVCPEGAIKLTEKFELDSLSRKDLIAEYELKALKCIICGRSFISENMINALKERMKIARLPVEHMIKLLICEKCNNEAIGRNIGRGQLKRLIRKRLRRY